MSSTVTGMFLVMIIYLVFMVVVGIVFSRKNETVSDFYLGGRKLGPFVTAMSAEASDMSSWLLMGLPGVAYLSGCAEAVWTAIGLAVGTYLNWLLVAKRLRIYSAVTGSITIPDFFSDRYHDNSHRILAVSALIIIIFFIPYTASGFAACGKLFSTLFGVSYLTAMIISAVIIVCYTTLGGFMAASTTDLIQSIVMTMALIIVFVFGIKTAGGMDAVIANAESLNGYLSLSSIHIAEGNSEQHYSFLTIASLLAWGLGYFGMPHILLRFMGIKDKQKLTLSRRIASFWVVIAMGSAIFIGIIGNAMSKAGAIDVLSTSSESETILIKTALLLSNKGFAAMIMGGLILAGILACTMSTADSQLLAAASSLSENLLHDCLNLNLSKKQSMALARTTVVAISIVSMFLAGDPDSSVFRIVSFAWAGFGACFGPTMLLALFWKRSNRNGAFAGMISGGIMVFLWKFVIAKLGGLFSIYELLPAFLIGLIINILVSLFSEAPDETIKREFKLVNIESKK